MASKLCKSLFLMLKFRFSAIHTWTTELPLQSWIKIFKNESIRYRMQGNTKLHYWKHLQDKIYCHWVLPIQNVWDQNRIDFTIFRWEIFHMHGKIVGEQDQSLNMKVTCFNTYLMYVGQKLLHTIFLEHLHYNFTLYREVNCELAYSWLTCWLLKISNFRTV